MFFYILYLLFCILHLFFLLSTKRFVSIYTSTLLMVLEVIYTHYFQVPLIVQCIVFIKISWQLNQFDGSRDRSHCQLFDFFDGGITCDAPGIHTVLNPELIFFQTGCQPIVKSRAWPTIKSLDARRDNFILFQKAFALKWMCQNSNRNRTRLPYFLVQNRYPLQHYTQASYERFISI